MRLGSIIFLVALGVAASRGPGSPPLPGVPGLESLTGLLDVSSGKGPEVDARKLLDSAALEVGGRNTYAVSPRDLLNAAGVDRPVDAARPMRGRQEALNASAAVLQNPLLANLAQQAQSAPREAAVPSEPVDYAAWARDALAWVAANARANPSAVHAALWLAPGALMLLSGLCLSFGRRGAARLASGIVGSCAGLVLILGSAAATGASALHLGALPDLRTAPAVWVLASAGLTKVIDPNAPIWNRSMFFLLSPVLLNNAARFL